MRLLDLFCGAGGAAMGYHRAGFDEIIGVDIEPQPHYPFTFVQADALTFPLDGFDVIHASPPCQAYCKFSRNLGTSDRHPDLIPPMQRRLEGYVYVLENVEGAPLASPFMLCGSMFGLRVRRHRLFESPVLVPSLLFAPASCRHDGISIGVYGRGTTVWHRAKLGRNVGIAEKRAAMGIDWMTGDELREAIPPVYTEWIGKQLLAVRSEECQTILTYQSMCKR